MDGRRNRHRCRGSRSALARRSIISRRCRRETACARLLAHADAGRCRCRHGGGARRPADRSCAGGRSGQDHAHRLDPSGLCGRREGKAGRRRGRFLYCRRCARFRCATDDRLRHGEARGRARDGDLGCDARRTRRFRRVAVRSVGLRGDRARRRARGQRQPCRFRRRL